MRASLASALVRSLFCGLLRQERRMAVFVAGLDETNTQGEDPVFVSGGYLAPEADWSQYFANSWDERVLNYRGRRIPYFHTTELRSQTFRKKHGISSLDADGRMNEAARIIRSAGYLRIVSTEISAASLRKLVIEPVRRVGVGLKRTAKTPDFYCFLSFVITCIKGVRQEFPDAEKVDFLVERKDKVTPMLVASRDDIIEGVSPEDAALVGEILPVGKERVPVQAADFLMWHIQRLFSGTLTAPSDQRRCASLFSKPGYHGEWNDDMLRKLGDRFVARAQALKAKGE